MVRRTNRSAAFFVRPKACKARGAYCHQGASHALLHARMQFRENEKPGHQTRDDVKNQRGNGHLNPEAKPVDAFARGASGGGPRIDFLGRAAVHDWVELSCDCLRIASVRFRTQGAVDLG